MPFIILSQILFKLYISHSLEDLMNNVGFILIIVSTLLLFNFSYFLDKAILMPNSKLIHRITISIGIVILLINIYISIDLNNFNFLTIAFIMILFLYLERWIFKHNLFLLLAKPLILCTLIFLVLLDINIISIFYSDIVFYDKFKVLLFYLLVFFIIFFMINLNKQIWSLDNDKGIFKLIGEINVRRLLSMITLGVIILMLNIFQSFFKNDLLSIIYFIFAMMVPLSFFAIFINIYSSNKKRKLNQPLFISLFSIILSLLVFQL